MIEHSIGEKMNEHIQFDKAKYERLKLRYKRAVRDKENSFWFEDEQYLTDFAKHVVDYLSDKF